MGKVEAQIIIDAPVQKVWEVLADIGGVAKWAPTIKHAVTTSKANSGVGCERECDVAGFGKVTERFVKWEDGSHYTYEVTGAGPMKLVRTTWSVRGAGNQSVATVSIRFRMKFGPLGVLMAPMAKVMMRKQVKLSLAGLKHYGETEEPIGVDFRAPVGA